MVSQRYLSKNTDSLSKTYERLSTGYRINHAGDDAAGLSLSEGLRSQVAGTEQSIKNIQDGINMLQIAEGGFQIISENLQRIRELSVQAANGTYATAEKQAMLNEIKQRVLEITRISHTATYNGISLLSSDATSIILQIGASTDANSTLDIRDAFTTCTATTLNILINETGSTWTADKIHTYMDQLDKAISTVVQSRAMIGAYQNRVESALDNLTVMSENLTAAESRIRDTDIAKETSNLTKYQILQQASSSVLSQANQLSAVALQLLQG